MEQLPDPPRHHRRSDGLGRLMRQTSAADLALQPAPATWIRLWDSEWKLRYALLINPEVKEYGDWKRFTIPIDHPAAIWITGEQPFVNVTIDCDGTRWYGAVPHWQIDSTPPCPTCLLPKEIGLTLHVEPTCVRVVGSKPENLMPASTDFYFPVNAAPLMAEFGGEMYISMRHAQVDVDREHNRATLSCGCGASAEWVPQGSIESPAMYQHLHDVEDDRPFHLVVVRVDCDTPMCEHWLKTPLSWSTASEPSTAPADRASVSSSGPHR